MATQVVAPFGSLERTEKKCCHRLYLKLVTQLLLLYDKDLASNELELERQLQQAGFNFLATFLLSFTARANAGYELFQILANSPIR